MSDDKIDLLEQKIQRLEKRIIGEANKDASYPKGTPEIIDTLASVKHQFHTSVADRKNIQPVLKQLGLLNDFLDPAYTDTLTLSQQAKADVIMSEEDFIRQTAAELEKVKDMTEVLGSEHIKVIPNLENKLQDLSKIHLQQQDKTCEIADEVKDVMTEYNNIITLLSKQFVQWDELVTKLEVAAQVKKPLD